MTNNDDAPSFKHKSSLINDTEASGTKNGVNIAVRLKYLNIFWRSLEMPLINCRVKFSLRWNHNCVLTTDTFSTNANATEADSAIFKIADAKLYVPVVTLSAWFKLSRSQKTVCSCLWRYRRWQLSFCRFFQKVFPSKTKT